MGVGAEASTAMLNKGDELDKSPIASVDVASMGGQGESVVTDKETLVEAPLRLAAEGVAEVLKNDQTNRYQSKDGSGPLLESERKLAQYFGRKFALGVNSGGMAIMLGLRAICAKLQRTQGANYTPPAVFSNAFTFNAVPSAVYNAGLEVVLLETLPNLTIDLDDLEKKILVERAAGKANLVLCLSYMRGRIADMDRVLEICKEHNVTLLEDNAHGYGCEWRGTKIGAFGVISTISTQSNKVINTGEGGYIFTDDDEYMAFFIFSAGCYEQLFKKHQEMTPSQTAVDATRFTTPNYSCRMTNIQAAMVLPQIDVMELRIVSHNYLYGLLKSELAARGITGIQFIEQDERITPVYDSLQVRIIADGVSGSEHPKLDAFIKNMQADHNIKLQKFHDPENARFFKSWKYLHCVGGANEVQLPNTETWLHNVLDMRLACSGSAEEMKETASAWATCYRKTFG